MTFRDRLLASLRAAQPVLDLPGVMVGGSQVPNLLQAAAASTLVVSQDVDLVIPVSQHAAAKRALSSIQGYAPSVDEPSVWVAKEPDCLEINFIGRDDSRREASETYALDDERLPLIVFGLLSILQPGRRLEIAGQRIPLPRPAGLLLEKLLTERSGLKGERDLLVALALLQVSQSGDLDELSTLFSSLDRERKRAVLSSLFTLSLMNPLPEMPDPRTARSEVARLVERLERLA